jgi:GNAT superfamily N-acetyltransferase
VRLGGDDATIDFAGPSEDHRFTRVEGASHGPCNRIEPNAKRGEHRDPRDRTRRRRRLRPDRLRSLRTSSRSSPVPARLPDTRGGLAADRQLHSAPADLGVVAEADGQIIGSNFLDERGPIKGVGPITIDPEAQGHGVGRRLLEAVMARGADARGIRLFQDSFNMQSLSLYASLGFEVREPAVVMSGAPKSLPPSGTQVRPLEVDDLEECERLCIGVHGFERTSELRDAIQTPALSPFVAVRDGRITAYATTVTFFPAAHGVAETEDDLCALIAGALTAGEEPASFLLPTRQADLFRWCLNQGMRPVKPMTYMTIGEYREPAGGWIPSVLY